MKSRFLLGTVFTGAVLLAVGAWVVAGVRWLVTAPARAVRAVSQARATRVVS